jgi:hypothetical protein
MPAFNTRPLRDPLVAGVDHAGEFLIGEDPAGEVSPAAKND